MVAARTEDIVRLFPGLQDHAVLEIIEAKATVAELEAALLLLQDDDEALRKFKNEKGDRLNHLASILTHAQILAPDESEV